MSSLQSFRKSLIPHLTLASHKPISFLSAFLLVHLSAPLVANIGGPSLSSSVMLLGRNYYQGTKREWLLVFGPLGIHVFASVLKRLISPYPPRRLRSLLSITGYVVAGLLPIHLLIHRFYPRDTTPPISSLGPAELNLSFVQHALQKWPVRSVLIYGVLAGATILHTIEGFSLLYDTYEAKPGEPKRWDKSRVQRRRILGTVGIAAVVASLYSLWSVPMSKPLPSLLSGFDTILEKSLVYRL